MTIGLTGATGFLGQRLLPLLTKHDLRLTTLAGETLDFTKSYKLKAKSFPADLVSSAPDTTFYEDLDVLVHMVGSFSTDPKVLMDLNLASLMNVLRPLETMDKKPRVVFTSSCAVYGETPEGESSKETDPITPSTPYGFAKAWAEDYLRWHSNRYGYNTTVVRFPNIYGTGSQAVITKVLERIQANQPVIIEGDGQQVRDFLYVTDAAAGITAAIESGKSGTYNISTGTELTIAELVAVLGKATNSTPEIERKPANPFTQRRTVLDPTKAANELGWKPATAFADGLAEMIHANQ